MSEALGIETATLGDLAEIDALLARSYPALLKADYPPSLLVTAVPLIARANPRLVASGTYFVVRESGGRIVGAGGWTRAGPVGGPLRAGVGHIRHVATDHRETRRGVGRRLMAHVFASARSKGISVLDCASTRTAEPFYSAMGFVSLGPILVALRPGIEFPAIAMRRRLD